MKHYTDQEIIDGLQYVQNEGTACELMATAIARIEQKQKQIEHMRERLDIAANIIGHNMINEAQYEGY